MNKLQIWMKKATPAEKLRLAKLAETTIGTLRQVAGAYRTDTLHCSADLAIRIARASYIMAADNEKLPRILATQLCKPLRSLVS